MIERVKENDTLSSKIHYLPHHCVVREDKQTTKLRIVYNASAKEDGPSLNECLYSGPSLTPDILDILIRFRLRPIALVADIEKAFLMISVEENDRDVLRFLWVDDPFSSNSKVIPYRFTRVVFGVTSSPFLLNATLHKHINEYLLEDPPFVKEMLRSLYVDDLTTSLKDVETAYQFYNKARQRLAQGGFNLRKWLSNSHELTQRIKAGETREQECATETTQQLSEEDETYNRVKVGRLDERDANTEQKIIGINWNFTNDQLHFKFQAHVENAKGLRPTKRNILKIITGFYDPMGIISPIIVQMKMLLQEICKAKYSWDAELNDSLKVKWMKLLSELEEVQSIQVPRSVTMQTDEDQVVFELHGFCDASTSAYAAVVYMLSTSTYDMQAQLIASKTRIAPLKTLTIPRLELLGALILSRLISRIKKTLSQDISVSKVCCWTDSMNVLYWIQGKDKEWKQFVNSRVAEIRQLTCAEMWNYVPGVDNPADLASRGVDPSLLVNMPTLVAWPILVNK